MPVYWVAQRGEVAGEGHAGAYIVPQAAHPMDLHLRVCDVRGDAKVRKPQVLGGRLKRGRNSEGRQGGVAGVPRHNSW